MNPLEIEICDTPEKRALGLQFRASLPPDRILHFVGRIYHSYEFFHMRNVRFPIAIAALDKAGKVLSLERIEPETGLFSPPRGTDSVVEMHVDFPAKHGVEKGKPFPAVLSPP